MAAPRQQHLPVLTMLRSAILGRCPNCMLGRLFLGPLKPRTNCDVCGVSFEGDGSAWMVTAFMMYLTTCCLLIGEGVALGLLFGLFPGFIPVVTFSGVVIAVGCYRSARGLCVWWLWRWGLLG